MRLTHLAVRRRVATGVIALALTVVGVYSLAHLPVNFLPALTYPFVRIDVSWPGATPEEIVTGIAEVIERQVATVDGLDYLSSESREGRYLLEVNFRHGVDPDVAYQDVLASMSRATPRLPSDADPPIIFKADPSQLPVVQMAIRSREWDLVELRSWAERWLQDQVIAVDGVGGTEVVGGLRREVRVLLDPEALQKHGIGLSTVLARVAGENIQQFAGRVTVGPRELIARTDGEYASVEELAAVVLRRGESSRVILADVARVEDLHEPARIITRYHGEDGVRLNVNKQADANTVEVVRAVRRRMADLEATLPDHVRIGYMEDQAQVVTAALAGVRDVIVLAAVLVVLVTYLFLGSLRQVLVLGVALPVILIVNFALMRLLGFSLNIFSLGGLVVAVGVVLDNSTVVLENITRLREEAPQAPVRSTVVDATRQVGPAVTAATVAYLALFAPFLLVPGLASLLMRELILVISGVVVLSLMAAVTLTPMLAAGLVRPRPSGAPPSRFQRTFAWLTRRYEQILERWLGRGRRWAVAGAFALVTAGGAWTLPRLGFEFLPGLDDGRLTLRVRLPTGSSVDQTDRVVRQVEDKLADDPMIESVFALSGGWTQGLFTRERANEGEISVQLVPRGQRLLSTADFVPRVRTRLAEIEVPGGAVQVRQARTRGIRAGAGGAADVAVNLQGPHLPTLFSLAEESAAIMRALDYLADIDISIDMARPEFQVRVDRVRAAELGLSVADIARSLRTLVGGSVATRYREEAEYFDVRVMVEEAALASRLDLAGLWLDRPGGGHVRLDEVAEVREASGPVEIMRENQVNQVLVSAEATGVSVGEAMARLEADLRALDFPAGYRFDFGGQARLMLEMRRTMALIVTFAIFFSFVVLAVQFDRLKLPMLILAALPACLAGMVVGLRAAGLDMGTTVIIGLLVVVAATVNDGVLLLNLAEEIRERDGGSPARAVIQAASLRLRPRLMTSVTVIAGLVPLALNLGEGGDMLQPMAVAAIGGLTLEILVALFLMPALYVLATRSCPSASSDRGSGAAGQAGPAPA